MPSPSPRKKLFLVGRLKGRRENTLGLRDYRAELDVGTRTLDKTSTDSTGRFLLEWQGRVSQRAVVRVFSPTGRKIGMRHVFAADLDSPDVMVFQVTDPAAELSNSNQPADSDKGLLEVRFVANNNETVRVECACLRVKLEWSVQPVPRIHLSDRKTQVILLADGQVVSDELPLKGEYEVAEDHTVVYEIRVGRGEVWQSKRVEVRRYPALALSLYRPSPKSRGSVFISAQLTCPAPKEGIRVELATSFGELREREVYIAPGNNWAQTQLRVGNKRGRLSVTGTASHYLRDTIVMMLPESGHRHKSTSD